MDNVQRYIELAIYVAGIVYIAASVLASALPKDSKAAKVAAIVATDIRAFFGPKLPPPPAVPTNLAVAQ
jgi:hypothetical protein